METFPVDRGDDWFLYQSPFIQKERRNLVCDVNVDLTKDSLKRFLIWVRRCR